MNRRLLPLWFAQAVSVFGDMLTFLALPILVYRATGSKAALSATILVRGVPAIVAGPFASALADRYDRRRLMVATDLLRAVVSVPIVLVSDAALVPTIYGVVAVNAVIGSVFQPAMASVIPAMVDRRRLMTVNSVFTLTFRSLQFLAPLLGAYLISAIGARALVLLDIGSFLVSATLMASSNIPPHEAGHQRMPTPRILIADTRAGLVYIGRSKPLLVLLLAGTITMFGQGFISPVWLPYVVEVLHRPAEDFGILVSLQGLGCMAGSLLILWLGIRNRTSVKSAYVTFVIGSGITIFMQVTTTDFSALLAWATCAGLFIAGRNVAEATLRQHATDQALMGRVSGAMQLAQQGAMMVAVLLVGVGAARVSTRALFLLACSLYLAGCMLGAVLMALLPEPGVRKVEHE